MSNEEVNAMFRSQLNSLRQAKVGVKKVCGTDAAHAARAERIAEKKTASPFLFPTKAMTEIQAFMEATQGAAPTGLA